MSIIFRYNSRSNVLHFADSFIQNHERYLLYIFMYVCSMYDAVINMQISIIYLL